MTDIDYRARIQTFLVNGGMQPYGAADLTEGLIRQVRDGYPGEAELARRLADAHQDRTDAIDDQDRLRAAIRHAAARIGIAAIKAPDDLKPRLLAISGGLREAVEPEADHA